MKIAIIGHKSRGRKVIQILESLGGSNPYNYSGDNPACYYEIHGNTILCARTKSDHYKYYTLEEFEKEFPFKVGDIVLIKGVNKPHEVITLEWYMNKLCYKLDNGLHYAPETLTTYKEMKEERNITLTLEKAKEWYEKGGELKEIALQAFSEKELNSLSRSWEEFCEKYPIKRGECILEAKDRITVAPCNFDGNRMFKNWIPSKKSAEAHIAMIQLEQLRDCYNNNSDAWGWSYSIIKRNGIPELVRGCDHDTFLRFKNEVIAIQFLKNFKDLIEKAGDLI